MCAVWCLKESYEILLSYQQLDEEIDSCLYSRYEAKASYPSLT